MRKQLGRVKAGTKDSTVAAVTFGQKILIGAAVTTFVVEVFVSGVEVRVAKTVCWISILGNAWYHFMRYNSDLGVVFGDIKIAASPTTLDRTASGNQVKVRRAKNNLRRNMQMLIVSVNSFAAVYLWWPEGKEGFGCALRSHNAILTMRFMFATLGGLTCHASFLHAIWFFKKKRKPITKQSKKADKDKQLPW